MHGNRRHNEVYKQCQLATTWWQWHCMYNADVSRHNTLITPQQATASQTKNNPARAEITKTCFADRVSYIIRYKHRQYVSSHFITLCSKTHPCGMTGSFIYYNAPCITQTRPIISHTFTQYSGILSSCTITESHQWQDMQPQQPTWYATHPAISTLHLDLQMPVWLNPMQVTGMCYTVFQKISTPSCLRYSLFHPKLILIIFGRNVAKGCCNVKNPCLLT